MRCSRVCRGSDEGRGSGTLAAEKTMRTPSVSVLETDVDLGAFQSFRGSMSWLNAETVGTPSR